jgi:hypothetical protein
LKFSAPRHTISVTENENRIHEKVERECIARSGGVKQKYIKEIESQERRRLERTIDKSTKNEHPIQTPAVSIIEQEIKDSC